MYNKIVFLSSHPNKNIILSRVKPFRIQGMTNERLGTFIIMITNISENFNVVILTLCFGASC
jgi:hypothetical protein